MIIAKLNKIRAPHNQSVLKTVIVAALSLLFGIMMGFLAKWLDNTELEFGLFDLGNFFSDMAIWLMIALVIAVYSLSAWRAALNVFLFFSGMCAAYHLYTVLVNGFNPSSYMMIWYGITLASPILGAVCWYAKGQGIVPIIIDICLFIVLTLSCFSLGLIYISLKNILYVLVFLISAAVLYKSPKQLLISLPSGFVLAFLCSPIWPY